MKKLFPLLPFLFFAGCEFTIGDKNVADATSFEEISVLRAYNYPTTIQNDISLPDGFSKGLYKIYQYSDLDTLLIGTYQLEEGNIQLENEVRTSGISIEPVSINGTGNLLFEIQSNNQTSQAKAVSNLDYYSQGDWSLDYGLPYYLEKDRDVVPLEVLNDINASLPENRPVPTYNPEYLQDIDMNTVLTDNADVWVTFVHEGAGYKNTLGYFTFREDNPPSSISEVDSLNIIFPNVSFHNSGGQLTTGDKVYLGRFNKGDVIAWFLLPNAWVNNSGIRNVDEIKYSIREFNDFTSEEFQQHTIILNDEDREILLLSFEDISRPGGDNDFNDAIFYVTANPYEAVQTASLVQSKKAKDSDGDGLFDHEEDYPNDPERAYSSCFPSCNSRGTLLFEDKWPSKGDYDFNDVVADYRFKYIHNANGKVKELQIETVLRASGGLYKTSLLFNLGIDQSLVQSVSGNTLLHEFIKTNANGTESGLNNAVIPIFDNAREVLSPPAGYSVTNVLDGQPHKDSFITNTIVTFAEPVYKWELNAAPHDPFIVVEFDRGREIHLPGNYPTEKADLSLFGTKDDRTELSTGFTYKSELGHPWALHISNSIRYPKENRDFSSAYIRFKGWAESRGSLNIDWYTKAEKNTNDVHLYRSW